jgi:hypothetical protein
MSYRIAMMLTCKSGSALLLASVATPRGRVYGSP